MPLFDQAVAATLFDNLTEVAADGTLRGDLATNWSSDARAVRWRFNLRGDVAFHDGERFGAEHLFTCPAHPQGNQSNRKGDEFRRMGDCQIGKRCDIRQQGLC